MVDPRIETKISPRIAGQLPLTYRERGPLFAEFMTAYYEWLESDGEALHHARRFLSYKDVDETPEEFLVHFAQKYLSGIQLQTETNTRQLIKHSLDLYRTKGTDRSISLFFRLIYGQVAWVYHPSRDILRLSDGTWRRPNYIEIVPLGSDLSSFINFQVVGVSSGAQAFVERVVRKKTSGRWVDLMYLSSVVGEFKPGEYVNRQYSPLPLSSCPVTRGSLTSVSVVSSDAGFSIGDSLPIISGRGHGALARVTGVASEIGLNSSTLLFGGYGYTANAETLVSDTILTCGSMIADSGGADYAPLFANLSQPVATVTVSSYSNGQFLTGEPVFTYDSSNTATGGGVIVSSDSEKFVVSVLTGNMESSNVVWNWGNTRSANVSAYLDQTSYGRVIGIKRATMSVSSGAFIPGEVVSQAGASATVVSCISNVLEFTDVYGQFDPTQPIVGSISSVVASISGVTIQIGVDQTSGSFLHGAGYYYSIDGVARGVVTSASRTPNTPMTVAVVSLVDTETVNVATDELSGFVNVGLSNTYPFDAFSNSTTNTVIDTSLTYVDATVGRVERLALTDPGSGYDTSPVVRVYEPLTYPYVGAGWTLGIDSQSSLFLKDEIVTQEATNARGSVVSSNSSVLVLDRLRFQGDFVPTTNSTTTIVGSTGTTANVSTSNPSRYTATGHGRMGSDALVRASVVTGEGVVTSVEVTDSGLGYEDGEAVQMTGPAGAVVTGTASADGHGVGSGQWIDQPESLSGTRKIFDNDYYQEFSYEIRSQVALSEYEDIVGKVVHPAGKKMFALYSTTIDVPERIRFMDPAGPTARRYADMVVGSNSGLTVTDGYDIERGAGETGWTWAVADSPVTGGLRYFEVTVSSTTNAAVGFLGSPLPANGTPTPDWSVGTLTGNVVVRVAVDSDEGLAWVAVGNGAWNSNSSADPSTSAGPEVLGVTEPIYAAVGLTGSGGATASVNFGRAEFVYGLPTGFTDWR